MFSSCLRFAKRSPLRDIRSSTIFFAVAKPTPGRRFAICSAGAAFRTHERVYGVNPYEIWVSALNPDGSQANYWYELAYEYGYQDAFYTTTILNPITGQEQNIGGYFWWAPEGRRIASSDLEFRDGAYKRLISEYNNDILGNTAEFGLISPPVGMNLYLSSYRFEKDMPTIYSATLPFFFLRFTGVMLITYIPLFF